MWGLKPNRRCALTPMMSVVRCVSRVPICGFPVVDRKRWPSVGGSPFTKWPRQAHSHAARSRVWRAGASGMLRMMPLLFSVCRAMGKEGESHSRRGEGRERGQERGQVE